MIQSVASKSTDFGTDAELIEELRENQYSYLHVTKGHMILDEKFDNPTDFLPQSRAFLKGMIDEGVLVVDKTQGFYIYRQTINGTSHTGVIGLVDIEDYQSEHIKRHEYTRHDREEFISELIDTTAVLGEPLLLSHHHKQSLEDLLRLIIQDNPSTEFEKGGRFHQIWRVIDVDVISMIQREMSEIQDFYIMDGHHRISSVSELYERKANENYRYALSFVLDANQLSIAPFHRYICDSDLTHKELLRRLEAEFEISQSENYILHPAEQRTFILKCSEGTYVLKSRRSWGGLDVDLFEQKILNQIFDIHDTRSDRRLQFLAGDDHLNDALSSLDSANNFLFLLHPCVFREIAMTSDARQVLPPKSTYVEPKCRAGLFIQPYGDNSLIND